MVNTLIPLLRDRTYFHLEAAASVLVRSDLKIMTGKFGNHQNMEGFYKDILLTSAEGRAVALFKVGRAHTQGSHQERQSSLREMYPFFFFSF